MWHSHPETDETFIVIHGKMQIHIPGRSNKFGRRGNVHRPEGGRAQTRRKQECHILMIELAGTINTGDAGGQRTIEETFGFEGLRKFASGRIYTD